MNDEVLGMMAEAHKNLSRYRNSLPERISGSALDQELIRLLRALPMRAPFFEMKHQILRLMGPLPPAHDALDRLLRSIEELVR